MNPTTENKFIDLAEAAATFPRAFEHLIAIGLTDYRGYWFITPDKGDVPPKLVFRMERGPSATWCTAAQTWTFAYSKTAEIGRRSALLF